MALSLDGIPPDHHWVVCILGNAAAEDHKVYRWAQWERCVRALDPIVQPFRFARVESRQAHRVVLGTTRDGATRVTFKPVPTGGARKWSHDANHDIATKYLSDPQSDVRVLSTTVWAADTAKPADGWDVFCVFSSMDGNPAFDQSLMGCVSHRARTLVGAIALEASIRELASAMYASKIATTHRPWAHRSKDPRTGSDTLDVLMDRTFAVHGTTELRANPWAAWTELSLPT